jgi:hypothetical protein
MNVEIGAEAAQFPEKKYINGIALAVYSTSCALQFQKMALLTGKKVYKS